MLEHHMLSLRILREVASSSSRRTDNYDWLYIDWLNFYIYTRKAARITLHLIEAVERAIGYTNGLIFVIIFFYYNFRNFQRVVI